MVIAVSWQRASLVVGSVLSSGVNEPFSISDDGFVLGLLFIQDAYWNVAK